MRYLMLSVTAVVCLIFTGAVFPNLNIAGIAPDLLICCIASIAVLDKTMAGAAVGLVCGVVLDLLFSGIIGLYALPYMIAGAALYFLVQAMRYIDNVLLPTLFAVGAYIVKELTTALIVYMLSIEFTLSHMFIRYILPEAIVTGVFMLLIHIIYRRIYQLSSVRPRDAGEFKHL